MFLNGVGDIVGKQIEFPKWFDADEVTKVEAGHKGRGGSASKDCC